MERRKRKKSSKKKKKVRWKLKSHRRGWRRFDPTRGEEHKMILDVSRLEGRQASERQILVSAVKPFADATLIAAEDIRNEHRPIVHFIVPVARLSSRFDEFILNYENVCLKTTGSAKGKEDPATGSSPQTGLGCALILVVF